MTHPRCQLHGSLVALITPMRGGKVDWIAFERLLEWHLQQGTDGIVVCGTTGESATLTAEERRKLVTKARLKLLGRIPLIVGVGTNDTRTTLEHAREAELLGADALLAVTPYYNKPSPRGLVLHYSALAEATRTPIVLYNVPSRTGVDMPVEVVKELGERHAHIVAVKEAKPDLERVRRLVAETPCAVLCGDDASLPDFLELGAVGVIGVVNNLLPAECAALVRMVEARDTVRAAGIVERFAPLARDLFLEPNPVPVKWALAEKFPWMSSEVRLPLAPLEPASRAKLAATLRATGVLAP
jgi:4-hydroxy-tetrahydrodipicolinate synthase